jgi:hypothetical protein
MGTNVDEGCQVKAFINKVSDDNSITQDKNFRAQKYGNFSGIKTMKLVHKLLRGLTDLMPCSYLSL